MPKDRRVDSLSSSDRDSASPCACISKDEKEWKLENSLPTVIDEKDWKEARCPICMEYPHNAVLLLCSSCAKGCRPYICDTSSRHSNCLDQFLNVSYGKLSTKQRDVYLAETPSSWIGVVLTLLRPTKSSGGRVPEVLCPFCRGRVIGLVVVENVRSHMNSKVRNCSLESCNFSGKYKELRKHARRQHPNVKPSDPDPERKADWARLMFESDLRDTTSLVESQFEDEEFSYSPYESGVETSPTATVDNNSSTVSDTAVDLDFSFSLLYDIFGPNGSLTPARPLCMELITSISQAYCQGRVPFYRRQNTVVPSRSGLERVRERTDDRLLDRRSVDSDSGSCSENTVNEITGDRSLDRRSTGGSRSRFRSQSPRMAREIWNRRVSDRSIDLRSNSQSEVTSGRRVRNSGSRSTAGGSSAERSVATTTSHGRWRNTHRRL